MAVKTQRGIALIVVLWMIMIMMTLAASLLYATRTQSSMLDYSRQMAQARAIADAAVQYAVLQLYLPNQDRELQIGGGALLWQYEGAKVEIRVVGENGLIDVNVADRELLRKIIELAGLKKQDTEHMVDALEDFRDVDDLV